MKGEIQPPTYFAALLLVSAASHYAYPGRQVVGPSFAYMGLLLVGFGVVLNLWTDSLFKKNRTTVKPQEMPSKLLITGPFRISRHPMYLGMVSILLGEAVFLGSLIAFVFPLIFAILMGLFFIPREEENLERAFGREYVDYKRRVRRWI
ncbi:isoprenylcysteine carboxylmethyltransferase family protein [Methanotrichaceae archaeon M04Ac]|uniref:Isoprenylcysteine carboxylmethyltransferase family protein n=1 Tax=Candidatus Methanocrinis alkalitolerans TaxID=3033395 RepID=A0ABT5XFP6_9EURY|nr:isoprenylcysteine carboxylmethyltransferase family protein [Candidatus Methanocrinis alkalitolerans]MCR3884907.1 isoprenylcysteine carboxylmethyltransferase family protein [Methanothrix sp.]MDF0593539.1 isoprenylcysteine carboxylmethyltransferase family protein [Candidatus Methanocrinis alkalitolerans]